MEKQKEINQRGGRRRFEKNGEAKGITHPRQSDCGSIPEEEEALRPRSSSSQKLQICSDVQRSGMEDHGNNQVTGFLTKVISEMDEIKGELRSLNNGLISLRDDQKRFEDHTRESLQYIMNGLKRVEGFGQYGGVDGSGKKDDGSVDNLHQKHNSCFAKGINIENKRARYVCATDFCSKGEKSSAVNSNLKGEAVRGVKVTTASVIRVDVSSDMKKYRNRFEKPVVFDKSGSCPKVSYKCGPYHLSKPLVDVNQHAVCEYIFDEKLDPLECIVETSRNYLNRRQMLCLKPGCWLEGEVINVIMEFLTDCERIATRNKAQTWYLNTRMNSEAMGNPLDVQDFIRRHRYQSFFMGPLVHCRKIYVPINPGKHWIVMLVSVDDEVVEIWDSYLYGAKSTGEDLVYDVLTVLDAVLKDEIASTKPSGWSFSKFSIRTPQNVPQQPNLYDCGVFAINIVESRDISELTLGKNDFGQQVHVCFAGLGGHNQNISFCTGKNFSLTWERRILMLCLLIKDQAYKIIGKLEVNKLLDSCLIRTRDT